MSERSSSISQGNEKPLKNESDTEDAVKLSDVPQVPHDPEIKSEIPAQLQKKEPEPGNEGGKENKDKSQSQNITAKATELVSSVLPKKKRKTEDGGFGFHNPKRVQLQPPPGTIQNLATETPKSVPLKKPKTFLKKPIAYQPRNSFRLIFIADDREEDEKLYRLRELHKRSVRHLAIGLGDCEPNLREKYIKDQSEETLEELEGYICEMYEFPKMYDIYNNFPKLITPGIVTDMVEKKAIISPNCFVCNKPFRRFERYYPKPCGGHIMHYNCLAESIKKGKEVLNGHCECATSRR